MESDKTPGKPKKQSAGVRPDYRWIGTIFGVTCGLSAAFSFISSDLLGGTSTAVSFLVLFAIIFIGIIFDVVGVAVTAAKEQPFHSMSARRIPEATVALRLLRKANRVSSFCNDVIGDICGIISGTAAATIAVEVVSKPSQTSLMVSGLLLSALVAGLTVGGKAFGKSFAMNNSTAIIVRVSKIIYAFNCFGAKIGKLFSRNKSRG